MSKSYGMTSFGQHGPGRTKARGAPPGVMGLGDTRMMFNVNRHFFTTAGNDVRTARTSVLRCLVVARTYAMYQVWKTQ